MNTNKIILIMSSIFFIGQSPLLFAHSSQPKMEDMVLPDMSQFLEQYLQTLSKTLDVLDGMHVEMMNYINQYDDIKVFSKQLQPIGVVLSQLHDMHRDLSKVAATQIGVDVAVIKQQEVRQKIAAAIARMFGAFVNINIAYQKVAAEALQSIAKINIATASPEAKASFMRYSQLYGITAQFAYQHLAQLQMDMVGLVGMLPVIGWTGQSQTIPAELLQKLMEGSAE